MDMDQVLIAECIGELVRIGEMYEAEDNVYRFTEDGAASLVNVADGVVHIEQVSLEDDDKWYCMSAKKKMYPFIIGNFKTH